MINIDTLVITKPILNIIAEIDEFKGAWSTLGKLAPDRLEALRHVATIESIGSSTRIEGSKLSDRDVEVLLANIRMESFANRDQQEVAGYAALMETVFEAYAHIPLTENVIKQFHRDLLQYSHKDSRHRGEYKTTPNRVEAFDADGNSIGVVFQTSSPYDTPNHMTELTAWFEKQKANGELHPLLMIAVFVVVFLEIHPFQDGNGRLSRIITTLLLLRFGYSYVPYSSMESVIEQNKDTYYLALRRTQKTIRSENPDWQPWVSFFLQSLQHQKDRLQKKIERERIVFATLPELSRRILTFIQEHGRASVAEIVKATGTNRNTIKDHVRQLAKTGHLTMHGAGRGTWYAMA
ncbi:MAG: Fic family protein [Phycisphaerae bacterium]|nr:Fic family protein [Phycisphaerae bacterium]